MRPLDRVADELGIPENELAVLLRRLPGAPFEVRNGKVLADVNDLGEFLAEHGIDVPAEEESRNPRDRAEDDKNDDDA